MLNTVSNIKVGKSPQPNNLLINENVTWEIYENKFFKRTNVFKKIKKKFNFPKNEEIQELKQNIDIKVD